MTYNELKREFERPSFRVSMKNALPKECVCCGERSNIEYHHVVPLKLGGTNRIANIVTLCAACHKAAHRGRHIAKYTNAGATGRKSIASIETHSHIFDMYINGEIGNLKCIQMIGYSNRTPIKELPVFKRYMKSKGISKIRNLVDVAAVTRGRGLINGDEVGQITYQDGRIEKMLYKESGANDIEYEKRGLKCRA